MNPSEPTQPQGTGPEANTDEIQALQTPTVPVASLSVDQSEQSVTTLPAHEVMANDATQQVVSMANTTTSITTTPQQPASPTEAPQPEVISFTPQAQTQQPQQVFPQPNAPIFSAHAQEQPESLPLAMQPVPTKKNGALKVVIIVLVSLFVLAALSVGGFFLWKTFAVSPTDRFYSALENGMSTKYAQLDFSMKTRLNTTTYAALIDSSDPTKPKASVKMDAKNVDGSEIATINFIDTGDKDAYMKYTSNNKGPFSLDTGGKWIKTSASSEGLTGTGGISTLSSNFFMLGNYNKSLRNEVLKTYKEQKAVQFNDKEVIPDDVDGKKLLKYTATVNNTAMKAAFEKVAKALDQENSYYPMKDGEKISFWIDPSSNRIVRFETQTSLSSEDRQVVNVSYPSTASIVAPADAITQEEWMKSLAQ